MKVMALAVFVLFVGGCADIRYKTADESRPELRGRYTVESSYSRLEDDPDYYNPRYELNRHMGGEL